MIDPKRLLELRQVAESGSMTKAAAVLGVSQPALSKSIALLERSVGVPLTSRTRRGSALTNAGELLLGHGRALNALLRRAEEEIARRKEGKGGTLRVGASPVGTAWLVPQAIAALRRETPDVSVHLAERPDDELIEQLKLGELDVVVNPAGNYASPLGVRSETLTRDRFALFVGAGHSLVKSRSITLRELRQEWWVLPDPRTAMYRQIDALFGAAGEPIPLSAVTTNSITALKAMIIWNSFVSISSTVLMGPEASAGYIKGIKLRGVDLLREIVVRTRDPETSPIAQRFVKHVHGAALHARTRGPASTSSS